VPEHVTLLPPDPDTPNSRAIFALPRDLLEQTRGRLVDCAKPWTDDRARDWWAEHQPRIEVG
jgi:hypothetical protein